MNTLDKVKKRNIVVDTNVVILYSQEGFKTRSKAFLDKLIKNGNILFVSQFTGLELLRDQDPGKVETGYGEFLSEVNNIHVSFSIIKNAILLSKDYRHFLDGKKVSIGDLIIGGSAIHKFKTSASQRPKKTLLLTENRKDYPELLWRAVACHPVFSKDKKRVTNIFYLLEFNTGYLDRVKGGVKKRKKRQARTR